MKMHQVGKGWGLYGLLALGLMACHTPLRQAGRLYQKELDPAALQYVVDHLPTGADTATLRRLLGPGIDMGFDWRYLIDSIGEQGCMVGAVFHLDEAGRVDQQWLGEICE